MSTRTGSEPVGRARAALAQIAAAAGIDTEVRIEDSGEAITAELVGGDLAVLIGVHGRTIDAVQHLVHRIAFHGISERRPLTVDAAGYRARRAAALQALADRAADQAARERHPIALEPMSAQERKVVHEHLKTRADVATYSEGEEPARRLVVAPLSA
ncbi:MAG: KH domain-containing protein [Actinomycetota bacterium]|nr:KH domain-containing protein [Actinomycetota bacterium]